MAVTGSFLGALGTLCPPAVSGDDVERSTQLIRRWQRRHWIEFVFWVLKHLLATESGQVEDAFYVAAVVKPLFAYFSGFSELQY
jgi:hypothetical protein